MLILKYLVLHAPLGIEKEIVSEFYISGAKLPRFVQMFLLNTTTVQAGTSFSTLAATYFI